MAAYCRSVSMVGGKLLGGLLTRLRCSRLTANLGDTKTTIVHPATTTHARLSDEDRDAAGISDSLIRIAVGLEDIADIKADIALGLDAL